jgi:hypothetical protein
LALQLIFLWKSLPFLSYRGGKILTGASAEETLYYDLNRKLEKAQHHGSNIKPIHVKKWEGIVRRLLYLEKIFALGIGKENSHLTLRVDGKSEPLTPEQSLWVIPTGSLDGYHYQGNSVSVSVTRVRKRSLPVKVLSGK